MLNGEGDVLDFAIEDIMSKDLSIRPIEISKKMDYSTGANKFNKDIKASSLMDVGFADLKVNLSDLNALRDRRVNEKKAITNPSLNIKDYCNNDNNVFNAQSENDISMNKKHYSNVENSYADIMNNNFDLNPINATDNSVMSNCKNNRTYSKRNIDSSSLTNEENMI